MDTPELAQLYRRYQRYERLAKQMNAVLDEHTGDPLVHLDINPVEQTLTPVLRLGYHVVAIPKTMPRDREPDWYVAKYVEYRTKADNAHDLYAALSDLQQKQTYEGMSREEKLARLRQVSDQLTRVQAEIATWRAKVPGWERQQAERTPPETEAAAYIEAYVTSWGDPRPMITTLEDLQRERQAQRDWLLDHL